MSLNKKQVATCVFDSSRDDGSTGKTTLTQTENIPQGAIITNVYSQEQSTLSSNGSTDLQLQIDDGNTTENLTSAIAYDTGFTGDIDEHTGNTPFTTTQSGDLVLDISSASLKGGVVEFIVEYVIS